MTRSGAKPGFRLRHAAKPPSPTDRPCRITFRIAYDGTAYCGWQVQPGARSIQGELERVLLQLTGAKIRVEGSGRTDRGVHAHGQVAHADLPFTLALDKLRTGCNALLEPDIRVLSLRRVAGNFHARFNATGKEYRYFIWNDAVLPPFIRNYRAHVRAPLDIGAMRRAARLLEGRHDFAAFTANPNREVNGTVRTVTALRVSRRGPDLTLTARGDGFLFRMVRSLAGHLIRVGLGEVPPEATSGILKSRIRTAHVPTAPPQGLFLWNVTYRRPRKPAAGS
jgi:tRNA pseudouridine38-40 synthase